MTITRAFLLVVVLVILATAPVHAQGQPPTRGEVPTDVLFVLDSSASMSRDDSRGKASDPQGLRLSAVRAFIALATPRMRIGLVNLSDAYAGGDGLDKPTPLQTGLVMGLTDASPQGKASLLSAVGEMKTTHEAGLEDGFTFMSRALDLSRRVLGRSTAQQRYLIILSDGDVTGEDPRAWWAQARELQASGIKVVLFRLGRREPPGLMNQELAALNESLAPTGGAARVIDRPADLLGYYLQTFVVLNGETFVNRIGPMPKGEDQPVLNVQDWMGVTELYLLVPGGKVTSLVNDKLGRDLVGQARSELTADPNLEVLSLSRERLGALEGNWRIGLGDASGDVQIVFRSRVSVSPDVLLQPKGADVAVVSVAVGEGGSPIPNRRVLATGAAGDEPRPLLLGSLGPDRYSGVVTPDRDGYYRVRVVGPPQTLAPWLEKTFPVPTTDRVGLDEVVLGFERVTQDKLLKAGQPLTVRVASQGGRCALAGAALRVDATYPTPPQGVAGREANAAAQPLGPAPTTGLLYGFVPQAPGQVTFGLDHSTITCPGVPQPIGVAAGGRASGVQTFDVDVERLLKIERDSPPGLDTIPAGTDSLDVAVKYDLSSWRSERLNLVVQGLPGAAPVTPIVELQPRQGNARPQARRGSIPVKLKLGGPLPGGAKGKFTLIVQQVDDRGGTGDLARFEYAYEVAPGVLVARMSRDPQIGRDGVRVTLGYDPSRLVFPAVGVQEFEIDVVGLASARVEPKILRAPPRKEMLEQTVFIQSEDVCRQTGAFKFSLNLRPVPSPNGDIVVNGAPIEISVPLPRMELSVAAPERIGPLRTGVALPVTLQSSSLCEESLRLRVTDAAMPERFAESGVSNPQVQLAASDGLVKTVELVPERPAARGEAGAIRLEALRVGGHPSTVYPPPILLRYYNPLWTEEFPATARNTFLAIAIAITAMLALPRMIADPILAHRAGDPSIVSARKRFRWLLTSSIIAVVVSFAFVYWALARWMPQ